MPKPFEELAYHQTTRGELILRRRHYAMLGDEPIYEVLLNEEWLMSSLFHAAEEALAYRALEWLKAFEGPLDLVVGGLGLGYTALAALSHPEVGSLRVIEVFPEVIEWHQDRLIPSSDALVQDPRCRLVAGDFFAMTREQGYDEEDPTRQFHGVLLDIDHTHEHWLHPDHAAFYSIEALGRLRDRLVPAGVFAMWADGAAHSQFQTTLRKTFAESVALEVRFPNPIQGGESSSTIYLARK